MNNTRNTVAPEHVTVQERIVGEVRCCHPARGADWSWITPAEAANLARDWSKRYGEP